MTTWGISPAKIPSPIVYSKKKNPFYIRFKVKVIVSASILTFYGYFHDSFIFYDFGYFQNNIISSSDQYYFSLLAEVSFPFVFAGLMSAGKESSALGQHSLRSNRRPQPWTTLFKPHAP